MNESSKEQHWFEKEIFCNIINIFTVIFDQLNASMLNTNINFSMIPNDPKHLNSNVYINILFKNTTTSLKYLIWGHYVCW